MSLDTVKSTKRVLDPADRVFEVLFGLITVLTFTGSLSVTESGRAEVRTMLLGALGCNLAWGIIDGAFYLMSSLAEKGRALIAYKAVRKAGQPEAARRLIAESLPSMVARVMQPAELDSLWQRLKALPEPPAYARLDREDWLGAGGVCLLVFFATFPVVIPFLFMTEIGPALRVSNAIAVSMLFVAGFAYGRCAGRRPLVFGLWMVLLGAVLVLVAIALGG